MAKVLNDQDYWSANDVITREKVARSRRAESIGVEYMAYSHAAPGANPHLAGYAQDPQARMMVGTRGAQYAEMSFLYNSQLQISIDRFVNRVMVELFPDGSRWAGFLPGDDYDAETALSAEDAEEREEAHTELRADLKPIEKRSFQELHRSNFSEQAPDAIRDAAIARVGVLRVRRNEIGESPSKVSFQHVSQAECAFEWSPNGECWALFRRHYFNRRECEWYWPDGGGWTFPEANDEGDDNEARTTFTEVTFKAPGKKAWGYQVVQEEGANIVVKREFKRNPFIVFGLTGAPGSRLTRSLAEMALPTSETLNAITRITLEAAEWQASPTFTVEKGSMPIGQRTLRPGVVIPVKSNETGRPDVRPLEINGNPQVGWSTQEMLEQSIQMVAYDESLPPDRPTPRTATEINARLRELKSRLGAVFNRLMMRLGVPVLQHVVDVLYEEKDVDGMVREGGETSAIEIDGKEVAIHFANPLAQAQRLSDVEDIFGWLETMRAILPPEIFAARVNLEEVPEITGEKLEIDKSLYRKRDGEQELTGQALQTLVTGGGANPTNIGRPDNTQQSMMAGIEMRGRQR